MDLTDNPYLIIMPDIHFPQESKRLQLIAWSKFHLFDSIGNLHIRQSGSMYFTQRTENPNCLYHIATV